MTFPHYLSTLSLQQWVSESLLCVSKDVEKCLSKQTFTLQDLPILLSPASTPFIETMAQKSHQLTVQRFGKTMQLFIPLYLSNECMNTCTYCGFSREYTYERVTLSEKDILAEGHSLAQKGFQHLLLLTGESPKKVDARYIQHAVTLLSPLFSSIGIEVQPLETPEYVSLIQAGCDSLTLYQETYHPDAYKAYHLFGKKKNYHYRLESPERAAAAGFYRMNLGVLLGLYDFRFEALALAYHLHFLQKQYWKIHYGVSFPRIKEMVGNFKIQYPVCDLDFVKIICAFRLIFPDLLISLSTRESPALRNHLIPLGITQMSAESNTAPGGYSGSNAEKQFEISDHRPLSEICDTLIQKGYDPIFKNWDPLPHHISCLAE